MKKILLFLLFITTAFTASSQIKLGGYVTTFGPLDTYPTHLDSLGMGGYQTTYNITTRNAIPAARRKPGMMVRYSSSDSTFVLSGGIANSNWVNFATPGVSYNNIYFVSPTGSDVTGIKNSSIKPYLTITAAKNASVAGDLIYITKGVYIHDTPMNKDGITYYAEDGVTIQTKTSPSGNERFFFNAAANDNFNFYGNAVFDMSLDPAYTGLVYFFLETYLSTGSAGKVNIECKKIIGTFNNTTSTGGHNLFVRYKGELNINVKEDIDILSSQYVTARVFNDGIVNLNCRNLNVTTVSTTTPTAAASGHLFGAWNLNLNGKLNVNCSGNIKQTSVTGGMLLLTAQNAALSGYNSALAKTGAVNIKANRIVCGGHPFTASSVLYESVVSQYALTDNLVTIDADIEAPNLGYIHRQGCGYTRFKGLFYPNKTIQSNFVYTTQTKGQYILDKYDNSEGNQTLGSADAETISTATKTLYTRNSLVNQNVTSTVATTITLASQSAEADGVNNFMNLPAKFRFKVTSITPSITFKQSNGTTNIYTEPSNSTKTDRTIVFAYNHTTNEYVLEQEIPLTISTTDLSAYELLSNKQTDLTASATKYPTVNAVVTGLSNYVKKTGETAQGVDGNLIISGDFEAEEIIGHQGLSVAHDINGNNIFANGDEMTSAGNVNAGNNLTVGNDASITGNVVVLGTVTAPSFIGTATNNWSLAGNAGTVDGTNFIGSTDNIPLSFRVNGNKAGRVDQLLANTAFGYQTANGNTTGTDNTGFGYQSMYNTTTGVRNTVLGSTALVVNTTGSNNTALGFNSLYANTGNANTANGVNTLFNNTGDNNTATGFQSLYSNTSGNFNIANGAYSLNLNSTGSFNTGVGYAAGYNTNTTGSNNTAIGSFANMGSATLSNATAIGANAVVTTSNTIQLGDASVTQVIAGVDSTAKFISGDLQIRGNSPASGKVWTATDADGNGTWQTPSSSAVNLTGPITSVGAATSITSQTGTGSTFVMNTSPTLVTPNIGTPSAGVATNLTGIASGLTAGNVTTNANLTGPVTSSGNTTSIASSIALPGSPTTTTQSSSDNSTKIATTAYVQSVVSSGTIAETFGSWVPTSADVTLTTINASYVQQGSMVYADFSVTFPASASTSWVVLTGLPVPQWTGSIFPEYPVVFNQNGTGLGLVATIIGDQIFFKNTSDAIVTYANCSGKVIKGTAIYKAHTTGVGIEYSGTIGGASTYLYTNSAITSGLTLYQNSNLSMPAKSVSFHSGGFIYVTNSSGVITGVL